MPLYDFKCQKCHHVFEQIVVPEITMVPCRVCSAAPATRQLSAPGGITVNGRMVLSESQLKKIKEPVWSYPDGSIESAH